MIVLFTDFGRNGPYVGQMQAVLAREAPGVPVIDLFADVPAWQIQAAAYLLPAYVEEFPAGTVFLCVIDPGVGSARPPVVLEADGRHFVGPGNGLFTLVARRAASARFRRIDWRPARLSASFHGRDLFAPVAARLACGEDVPGTVLHTAEVCEDAWPDDLARVIYIDPYGNAMTGLRASTVRPEATVSAGGRSLPRARTFADVPVGEAFCYENANGLLELSVNQGSAADLLGLSVGSPVALT